MSDIESLRAVYLDKPDGEHTLLEVWDKGGANGDSVTPSTYNAAYRQWMADLLRKFLDESEEPGLISVGCGNAAVESELSHAGYRVIAIDALEEAVTLAMDKGVEAECADCLTWMPPPGVWTVAYADGLLGHLYDGDDGVRRALERFRSWLPEGRGTLVVSIDHPRTDTATQVHPTVPGFVWLSDAYLRKEIKAAGFRDIWSTLFTYERPLSGPRDRTIVTARA